MEEARSIKVVQKEISALLSIGEQVKSEVEDLQIIAIGIRQALKTFPSLRRMNKDVLEEVLEEVGQRNQNAQNKLKGLGEKLKDLNAEKLTLKSETINITHRKGRLANRQCPKCGVDVRSVGLKVHLQRCQCLEVYSCVKCNVQLSREGFLKHIEYSHKVKIPESNEGIESIIRTFRKDEKSSKRRGDGKRKPKAKGRFRCPKCGRDIGAINLKSHVPKCSGKKKPKSVRAWFVSGGLTGAGK